MHKLQQIGIKFMDILSNEFYCGETKRPYHKEKAPCYHQQS